MFKGKYLTLSLLIVFHLVLLINTKFTVWPEMVLYPYFMQNGFLLYKDIINPYFPFLSLILNLVFSLFGASIITLKIFTWFVILLSDFLIYFSALKFGKSHSKALIAVFIFIILQLSYGGNALWFELALVPLVIPGLALIFLEYKNRNYLFLSGLLLGLAVLTKQNAVLFYLPVFVYLISLKRIKEVFYFVLPGLVLGLVTLIYLYWSGLLNDFFIWAVSLPLTYTSQPGFVSLPIAIRQYLLLFFPATLGLGIFINQKLLKKEKFFLILVFLISLSFCFPRYEDFHSQLLIAVVALISIYISKKWLITFIALSLIIFSFNINKNWHQPERFIDNKTIDLFEKIKNYNSVYLLNSPDLAYFFAGKLPPKPWASNFPWYFEQSGFQERFIEGMDSGVEYVVIGERSGGDKYALGNYIPEKVKNYIENNYAFIEYYDSFEIWQKK